VAAWFAGIIRATAATALGGSTAATQSDLRPSGAVTSTMGSPVGMFVIVRICEPFQVPSFRENTGTLVRGSCSLVKVDRLA